MCAIIELKAGVTLPIETLENVVYNNPHGYGLIVKMKGKLEVIKECPEGGTDPDDVQELLEKYKKFHRFLHLRWKTEGSIDIDNVHPFKVYDKDGQEVYFMHNGTLHDYKPMAGDNRCDSKVFAEEFLMPFLEEVEGRYTSKMALRILSKFWSTQSRGLLISTKDIPIYLNYTDYKKLVVKDKDDKEVEFLASNDTYFDKVTRGYEFDRREEERKAKLSAFSTFPTEGSGTEDWPIMDLKSVDLSPNKILTSDLENLFADADLYTEVGTAALANLSEAEIMDLAVKNKSMVCALLYHTTGMYRSLLEDFEEIQGKLERASKHIADLKKSGSIISLSEYKHKVG